MLARIGHELNSVSVAEIRADKIQPIRVHICYEFLQPIDRPKLTKTYRETIEHIFLDDERLPKLLEPHHVIHGHKFEQGCAGPKFCHEYGFWPTAEYDKRFIKLFESRWKMVYERLGWEIPK